jgi:hypothetical protein
MTRQDLKLCPACQQWLLPIEKHESLDDCLNSLRPKFFAANGWWSAHGEDALLRKLEGPR